MMFECNLLSWYNHMTEDWHQEEEVGKLGDRTPEAEGEGECSGVGWKALKPPPSQPGKVAAEVAGVFQRAEQELFTPEAIMGSQVQAWWPEPLMVMVGMKAKAGGAKREGNWQDKCHNVVVVMAVGTLVMEALALAGMDPQAQMIWLEMDLESPLIKATKTPSACKVSTYGWNDWSQHPVRKKF